jgi:signal transduction histidine kinase/uncharacterized protein YhfF
MAPAVPTSPAPDLLHRLASGTAGVVGDAFVRALVRHVAEAYGAECVVVTEDGGADAAPDRVLASWPCCTELSETPEGALAIDLPGSDGGRLGRLVIVAASAAEPGGDALAVLRIFAARAAAEIERRRHQATLRAREIEVAAARSRVLGAADGERQRIGRDLHDGAQQRVVALTHLISLARRQLGDDVPPGAAALLDRAQEESRLASTELRELARGQHPAGLTEKGLGPALEALAARAPVPLDVDPLPERRLPAPVELTAFYLTSEALTNAVRHAGAERVRVTISQRPGTAVLTVADDGAGGADPRGGSGLRGLADRVAALGGRLDVDSPPGAGTRLTATIPLAPWRSEQEPFLEFGQPGDGGRGERSIQAVLSGARSVSVTLAREWELEGGVPRVGQLLPVMDHHGRRRATVEVLRVASLPFSDIDESVIAPRLLNAVSLDAWAATQRGFYVDCRDELALLFGEPGWTFSDDEPMVLTWYRPVAGDEAAA